MLWHTLLVFGAIGCLAADDKPCTLHDSGKYYDLNPLKSSKDYELQTPGDHLFAINICKRPVRESFGLKDVDEAEIGGFVRRDHGDFSIGTLSTALTIQDSRPRITLTNGSWCKSKSGGNHIRASTVIEFVCDTSVYGPGQPRLVAQLPPGDDEDACAFFIEWRTHVACQTNEPGGARGFFSILIVLLISLALLYLVAGTLYNRFVLHLRGVDQIPQFSIESMKYHALEAIDWIRDLAPGIRGGGAYHRTSSDSHHAPFSGGLPDRAPSSGGINPVSHQTQVPSATGESGGGFVRPQLPRTGSGAGGRRVDINPVSHQAQAPLRSPLPQPGVAAAPPPPPPAKKIKPRPAPFNLESTVQEREFMLGDDEDDEDDVGTSKPSAAAANPTTTAAPILVATEDNVGTDNPAATARGRDMGAGAVTLL